MNHSIDIFQRNRLVSFKKSLYQHVFVIICDMTAHSVFFNTIFFFYGFIDAFVKRCVYGEKGIAISCYIF